MGDAGRISGRIKIGASRSWESLQSLRSRVIARLEECKREAQTRATGADVHRAANAIAGVYGGVLHEMDRTNMALLPILADEFPNLVEEQARFVGLVSWCLSERSDAGKAVTAAELATVRSAWADLRSVVDVFVEHLAAAADSPAGAP